MSTNDFKPFAGGAGANVLSQAEYEALAALTSGFGSGILLSKNLNKVLRQGTVMASALAQWIADKSGDNVLDDGTTAAIETSLTAALAALGLRAASTSQTGVSQLATSSEAQALTDALKVLTPATLKASGQGSNQLLAASGYQKFPSGLIIQWGLASTDATGTATFSYPITFPNAAMQGVCVYGNTTRSPVFSAIGPLSIGSCTGFASTSAGAALNAASLKFIIIGY
jgi:hypothetical protein